jgi:serine/threonine-protein kinase
MAEAGLAVLFDGLDEAGSPARRDQIKDLIENFSGQLSADSRVLITSRPYDYTHRFAISAFAHYDLCEFDDAEIQTFLKGWLRIHAATQADAEQRGELLAGALKARTDIQALARNALLLTMIVRVHFGLGALPDSRLGLYQKCAETLLKHWAEAAGLAPSPISYAQKHRLLQRLAYEMQGEAQNLDEITLQISRVGLAQRFERYLTEEGQPNAKALVDSVIHRLHARDALLVQYGTDPHGQASFGFVHRSFQEYFAACWMAQEFDEKSFWEAVRKPRPGWNETLYLAVAQLDDRRRRNTLQDLLKTGNAEFAINCLKAAPPEQPWLRLLVQFLSKYTWAGREFESLSAGACADACGSRKEPREVLEAMFQPDNREAQSLAAAVELAEELARHRDHSKARAKLQQFFSEATAYAQDMVRIEAGEFAYGGRGEMLYLPGFSIDRFPVTNADFERMIPGHRELRNPYSDQDDQPVVLVNWYEARLYCRWRGCRLPTEQEWEKAASWDAARKKTRVYPWGPKFDKSRCNTRESGLDKTSPVGAYRDKGGASPYGCEDMHGNVWEWTESTWTEPAHTRVVRGGSFVFIAQDAACAYRDYYFPQVRVNFFGFRCART